MRERFESFVYVIAEMIGVSVLVTASDMTNYSADEAELSN